MVVHRRKKVVKQRGSHTHGYGSKKKHRGAGSRGGRGNAGTGKRAGTNVPRLRAEGGRLGKHGFVYHGRKAVEKTIDFDQLNQQLERLVAAQKVEKQGNGYIVDLAKLSCDKLLGSGIPAHAYHVKGKATANAEKKLKESGGSAIAEKAAAKE